MPSIEALWSVKFESSRGFGGHGVVVFETGRLFGGDISWYYTGHFETNGKRVKAQVKVDFHGEPLEAVTGHVPGQAFEIDLRARISDDGTEITGHGDVVGDPEQVMQFSLKRLADLP